MSRKNGVSLVRLDFWVPGEMRDWVDAQAAKTEQQRSEFMRDLVAAEQMRGADGAKIRGEVTLAVKLLIKARRFENESVRDYGEMAGWRRELDAFLAERPGDNPDDRFDTPERIEHREFINRLFRPRWPVGKGQGKTGIVTHRVAARVKRKAEKI